MSFIDLFSGRADLYAAARPTYPDALFDFVAASAPARQAAWDCGCGNGQAAQGLARHFAQVEASDASAAQIEHAAAVQGVRFSVQPAEATEFVDASFDAVCVAQALHWFDHDRFYAEVRRVLRPRGVLVAWAYDWMEIEPGFDAAFKQYLLDVIAPHWAPQNALVWGGYRDLQFPFEPIASPPLRMALDWSFEQTLAYALSWSATQRCVAVQGEAFFKRAVAQLEPLWGAPGSRRPVHMPLHVRAGRVA